MTPRIVFVGPKPSAATEQHPGGQLTAAAGIAAYSRAHAYELEIIDTLVSSFPLPPFRKRVAAGLGRVFALRRAMRRGPIDGVILFVASSFSFYERVLLSAIARMRGVRTVFCIRDGAFPGWMSRSPLRRRVVRALLGVPTRIVLQGSRIATVLTDAGVPREKVLVIPNWLPPMVQQTSQPKRVRADEPVRFVFVGWLTREKGVSELLDAFAELRTRRRATLDIVGGGTLEGQLRSAITARHVSDVHVHGWASADDVRSQLERSHVFVLPSYFEGFPNALLEAMAHGLPAVCSDVGAISDSIESGINGILVPPRDTAALVHALETYVTNPALVEEHSRHALERVRTIHDQDANLGKLFAALG